MNYASQIGKLLKSRLFKVGLVGLTGVAIQTLIFETLGIWLHLVAPSTAVIIGGETAIITNFLLNHHFSFRDRKSGKFMMQLLRFHAVVAGSLFIQWLFIFLTEHATSNVLFIHGAYIAGIGVGFITNYIGYHLFVWKHHPDPLQNLQ